MDLESFEKVLWLYVQTTKLEKLGKHEIDNLTIIERQFIVGASQKLLAHAFTGLAIARNPNIKLTHQDCTHVGLDFASLIVVSRATVETYSVLYLTSLYPDPNWRSLMQKHFKTKGLTNRSKFTAYHPDQFEKQQHERRIIDQLEFEIKALEQKLGATDREYTKIKYQLRLAGFGEQTIEEMYGLFSDYAHGGYLSALQIGQCNDEAELIFRNHGLAWIATALALTVKSFSMRFPTIRAIVDGNSQFLHDMQFFSALARMKELEKCKGLFKQKESTNFKIVHWTIDGHPENLAGNYTQETFSNLDDAMAKFSTLPEVESYLVPCPTGLIQIPSWC